MGKWADVAVVGGGPAGATAARILRRAGADVLLTNVDAGGTRALFRVGESLPPLARNVLVSLDMLERFAMDGHRPSYGNRSAWGTAELLDTSFIFSPYGHGWHIDRGAFDRMLLAAAADSGVHILQPARCTRVTRQSDLWRLEFDQSSGEHMDVRARWILDCSGRPAVVARRQGATRLIDDRLVAIAWMLRPASAGRARNTTEEMTTIESVADGWWYTAPLPAGRRIMAYLTDGDLLDVSTIRAAAGRSARLAETRHMKRVAAQCLDHWHGPVVLPANSSRLSHVFGEGWAAAGDAAASFDPLSSQGLIVAMASGRAAAEALLRREQGDASAIARYASAVDETYRRYIHQRTRYYERERRWPESDFWKRRKGPGTHTPQA